MEFKDNLKRLRLEKGVTQAELGEYLGLTKGIVSLYEAGKRKPSFEILEGIADYFNVNMDVLMGDSNLTFSEAELLNYFRMASEDSKAAILAFANVMSKR